MLRIKELVMIKYVPNFDTVYTHNDKTDTSSFFILNTQNFDLCISNNSDFINSPGSFIFDDTYWKVPLSDV